MYWLLMNYFFVELRLLESYKFLWTKPLLTLVFLTGIAYECIFRDAPSDKSYLEFDLLESKECIWFLNLISYLNYF